MLCVVS